ncbi:MAG: HD domain-containing protein [Syntrophomonadaceae bacterium]|nr:HD domain-containing protein [Syntrophomonadaceae bacterium]
MNGIITLADIMQDREVNTYIRLGNQYLGSMGFTEHGPRHLKVVADRGRHIMTELGFSEREIELTAIAAYLHDIGNVINRVGHSQSGAILALSILQRLGMPLDETAIIMGAIGNHDESSGTPVNAIAAALILADKSDVHRLRVRNPDVATFDIHDRVNYAVEESHLVVDGRQRSVTMELTIDIKICPVMEYFEIFLTRMLLCRRAAEFLEARFGLLINDTRML